MENKTKGALAALLATGLAAGGATFALWSDSETVDGGIVTAGNLDIAVLDTSGAFDVSPDRADGPHAIADLSTWRAVPGDVVEMRFDLDMALEGDNLVASLNENVSAAISEANPDLAQYVSVETELRDAEGDVVNPGEDGLYYFQASGTGQDAGTDDPGVTVLDQVAIDGTMDYQAVSTLTFSADTPDQVLVQTPLNSFLEDAGVSLDQVRDAGVVSWM